MGKSLIQQRRGKGGISVRWRAPSHRYFGTIKYRGYDEKEKIGTVNGKIVNIINSVGQEKNHCRLLPDMFILIRMLLLV